MLKRNNHFEKFQGRSGQSREQNISVLFIHRGEFKVANEFSLFDDKVGEVAIQRRSTHSRLERYFEAM